MYGLTNRLHRRRAGRSHVPASGQGPVFVASPVAAATAELGESPLWDPTTGLRWLDVIGQRLFTLDRDGHETSVGLSSTVSCIELGPSNELFVVATRSGFGMLDPRTGDVTEVVSVVSGTGVTMNDGAIDPRGRLWAGSAVRDDSWRGALYRLQGTSVSTHVEKIGMSNGIDWSPSGDVLYHVDSTAGSVTAWKYDPDAGEVAAPRVLRSVPSEVGLPDGLTVDADGNVWLAIWGPGQVWRLDPNTGRTTAVVQVPTPCTTSCAFGGPGLSTLYITTANHEQPSGGGLLYAAEVPAVGRLPHRFAKDAA